MGPCRASVRVGAGGTRHRRKRMRRRIKRTETMLEVYDVTGSRIVRRVTAHRGADMMVSKRAVAVELGSGRTVLRLLAHEDFATQAKPRVRRVESASPLANQTVLSLAEMNAVATGKSRTRGLSDWKRAEREKCGLPGYDFVERAQEKFERGFVPAGRAVVAA